MPPTRRADFSLMACERHSAVRRVPPFRTRSAICSAAVAARVGFACVRSSRSSTASTYRRAGENSNGPCAAASGLNRCAPKAPGAVATKPMFKSARCDTFASSVSAFRLFLRVASCSVHCCSALIRTCRRAVSVCAAPASMSSSRKAAIMIWPAPVRWKSYTTWMVPSEAWSPSG